MSSTPPPTIPSKAELRTLRPDFLESKPAVLLTPPRISKNLVVYREPSSPAAEQYRILAHAIEKREASEGIKTLAITSALEAEGKTITALNLAFALAENRSHRVLLCDLDLRRGGIATALGLGDVAGLHDVWLARRAAEDVFLRLERNLAFLPSGQPVPHPVGLFRSTLWKDLARSFRDHFDYILFDCAPLCVTGDMAILEDVIDRTLLVVRAGATPSEAVLDALEKIAPQKMLGFVVNGADPSTSHYARYPYPGGSKKKE